MKPGRKIAASAPSVSTHPGLCLFSTRVVLREGFRNVLPKSRFWLAAEVGLGENFYAAVLSQPQERVWSSMRVFENAKADVRETEEIAAVIDRLRTGLGPQGGAIAVAAAFRPVLMHAGMQRSRLRIIADEEGQRLLDTVMAVAPAAGPTLVTVLARARAFREMIGPWGGGAR